MVKPIESVKVAICLQVDSRGEWHNVRSAAVHYMEAPELLAYMRVQRDRWEACRYFEYSPMRIWWIEPSGLAFEVH